MKDFLVKSAYFISPIFLTFIVLELLLKSVPTEYEQKFSNFLDKKNDIEVLILGNSHSLRGINPINIQRPTYNLSMVSQRIQTDYEILKEYIDDMPKLKYLVLNISSFSLYEPLYGDQFERRLYWYRNIYNLNIPMGFLMKWKSNSAFYRYGSKTAIARISRYYIFNNLKVKTDIFGWMGSGNPITELKAFNQKAQESAQRHNSLGSSYPSNIKILNSIDSLAKINRIKLILLITPKSNFYTSQIDHTRIFRTDSIISEIVRENDVRVINLRTAQDFDLKDFSDGDHLNAKGATKLSLKLDSLLNKL